MTPVFSIIMTSFNYAPYVGTAIESVLAQSFEDWELLVVDDCSTDNSWAIIQGYKDPRIKAYKQEFNTGACAAYNRALAIAKGRYIACLDSDDMFMPFKLERQAAFFAANPKTDICGTFVAEIDPTGSTAVGATIHADWFNVSTDLNEPSHWLWENRLCHSGAVVSAKLHARVGQFSEVLTYTPDWQFWLRALIDGARFAVIPEPLVGYRNHGGNITHKNREGTVKEHAQTSAQLLIPWLAQTKRSDLIEILLQGFISNPHVIESNELQHAVGNQLMSGEAQLETGSAAIRLLITKEKQVVELWAAKTWFERLLMQRDVELAEIRQHWGVQLLAVASRKPIAGDTID